MPDLVCLKALLQCGRSRIITADDVDLAIPVSKKRRESHNGPTSLASLALTARLYTLSTLPLERRKLLKKLAERVGLCSDQFQKSQQQWKNRSIPV